MRVLFFRRVIVPLSALAGVLTLSFSLGQAPPPQPLPIDLKAVELKSPVQPASATGPTTNLSKPKKPVAYDRFRNLNALPDLTRQLVMSTQMSMEWLNRYNQPTGLFLYGYMPAVNLPMEDDRYLHQAIATFALCRAARFTGDEGYLVRANQAILTLLSGTTVDAATPGVRRTVQPSVVCNRVEAAGFLVMAINELPDPSPDLIAKSEELCAFIRLQLRDDGSLSRIDNAADGSVDSDGVNHHAGPALYGIALSQRSRPAGWKAEILRKTAAYYRRWFKAHPNPDFVPWMTAAAVEGYISTKENVFAEFAFEMNDWLRGLQFEQAPDPRRPFWRGGFKSFSGGKTEMGTPGIEAAFYVQSFADCCRLLRQMPSPDVPRYDRYRASLIRGLQFLTTLQFTESNTLHITTKYRMMLVGGFHPTWNDGNLRIDQNGACVSAFIQSLVSGADRVQ